MMMPMMRYNVVPDLAIRLYTLLLDASIHFARRLINANLMEISEYSKFKIYHAKHSNFTS